MTSMHLVGTFAPGSHIDLVDVAVLQPRSSAIVVQASGSSSGSQTITSPPLA